VIYDLGFTTYDPIITSVNPETIEHSQKISYHKITFQITPGKLMKFLLIAFSLLINPLVAGKQLNILLKMIPEQQDFFTAKILKKFEQSNDVKIQVSTFSDNWELKKKLQEDKSIDVVKIPMEMSRTLIDEELIISLSRNIKADKLKNVTGDYFLLKLVTFYNLIYFLPRKYETRIMVYMKSKVKDAVANWNSIENEISHAIKKSFNKAGLPAGYSLNNDPNKWTYLDVFVAGYYWAHMPGAKTNTGRIAHRGKDYSGTALGLMDRAIQMGAKPADLVNIQSPYFNGVLFWESVYAGNHIYNSESWEKGWSGSDIWDAMGEEKIYLSFLTQIDCYSLHGIKGAKQYLKNPDDMGFAVMPEAILADGTSKGKRSISTGGWFWGISSKSKNPDLAFDLMSFITTRDNQLAESNEFGMIPVRNDILKKVHPGFQEKWKEELYNISVQQLRINRNNYLPLGYEIEEVQKDYIKIWKNVMQKSNTGPLKQMVIKYMQKPKKSSIRDGYKKWRPAR